MSTGTPPAGNESGESGGPIEHISCTTCGHALVFSGPRPLFCGFCGKPLPRPTPESTVVVPPPVGPESPTLTPSPSAGVSMVVEEPQSVGGYRLLRRLGGGGMGTVYEAEGPGGHRVALKLIGGGCPGSEDAVERFRREGRLASALSHPRCVFVLAADEDAGRPYIVMELMPGRTLADLVRERGPLPPGEAVAKALDVLEGLREAHRLGVVHRDVKPSNCFLEADGRVKVGDFGLSKSLAGDARLTQSGAFLGTPLYASPEQVRGEALTPQSDVYSLAATLYFLLTGKAPFECGDAAVTLARIASDPAPSMRLSRPELSPALDRAVLRGLERDRRRRWRDLDEFEGSLSQFLPRPPDAAGPGARLAAFLVDRVALLGLSALLAAASFWATLQAFDRQHREDFAWSAPAERLALTLLWLAYFLIPERIGGFTPGKWLFGLRVHSASKNDRAGSGRLLLRSALFVGLYNLEDFIPWNPLRSRYQVVVDVLLYPSAVILGVGLLLSTVRRANGWRGLHEMVSGTRVIRLPKSPRRKAAARRVQVFGDSLGRPEAMPEQVGPYAVRGALRWDGANRVLAGEDRALGRSVLIWLRPSGDAPLSQARRDCARPSRLRWLGCGEQSAWQWDAFPAPAGRPLSETVAETGPFTWSEARPVLEQLADEIAAAAGEGSLPESLTVGQVWARADGGVLLLDVAHASEENEVKGGTPEQQATGLIGQTAVLTLEGKPRSGAGRVRAPIPEYASSLLKRLLRPGEQYRDVEEFRAALAATASRPAELTLGRRAAHVALLMAFLCLGICFCFLPSGWGTWGPAGYVSLSYISGKQRKGAALLRELEAGAARDFVSGVLEPHPLARPVAVYRLNEDRALCDRLRERLERQTRELRQRVDGADRVNRTFFEWMESVKEQSEARADARGSRDTSDVTGSVEPGGSLRRDAQDWLRGADVALLAGSFMGLGSLLNLNFWPLLLTGSALVFGGGITYEIMQISLVRPDGRRAGRVRCALRAALVWVPPALLLSAAVALEIWHWNVVAPDARRAWVPGLVATLRWVSLALLAAYPVLAVCFPRRAPHDRLVGTYLVPR